VPKGPKGEKRPADVIDAAITVARIATGEVEGPKTTKNPHAVALGKLGGQKGGKARSAALSAKKKKEAAKRAASARWSKRGDNVLCRAPEFNDAHVYAPLHAVD
jgi:hypothetical protein